MPGDKARLKLFMSNIRRDVVESDLEEYFSTVVPVKEIYIFYEPNGSSTGTGEVVLYCDDDARLLEALLNNKRFMGRFLRLISVYQDVIDNNHTYLFDNLPLDVTASDLKVHFRPPFRVSKAAVLYNQDGSSTGKAKVIFHDFSYLQTDECKEELITQCKIKDKVMGFSFLWESGDMDSALNIARRLICQSIYITDLNYDVEANDLKVYLSKYLDVMEATVFYNKDGTSTGTAEVTFYRGKEMLPYVRRIVPKLFEDRLDSVWFTFIEYEDNKDCNIENAQTHFHYPAEVGNHWEKYFVDDCDQVVSQNNNIKEEMECHKKADDLILTRRIRNGKSLLHKTLKLKRFNSFDEERCRKRNYIAAMRLGIPAYEFETSVVDMPYDQVYNEFKAYPLLTIVSTYTISNRNSARTVTGLVGFKSRGEYRSHRILLIEGMELGSNIIEMRCVPGLMKICWYYI